MKRSLRECARAWERERVQERGNVNLREKEGDESGEYLRSQFRRSFLSGKETLFLLQRHGLPIEVLSSPHPFDFLSRNFLSLSLSSLSHPLPLYLSLALSPFHSFQCTFSQFSYRVVATAAEGCAALCNRLRPPPLCLCVCVCVRERKGGREVAREFVHGRKQVKCAYRFKHTKRKSTNQASAPLTSSSSLLADPFSSTSRAATGAWPPYTA